MNESPIDLRRALGSFTAEWSPHTVTRVNDYDVRVVKVRGEFVWHRHTTTDEFFHVLEGTMSIALRDENGDERSVVLTAGSVFTVTRGQEHKPYSELGASVLLFEPSVTVNTGDEHETTPSHIRSTRGQDISI